MGDKEHYGPEITPCTVQLNSQGVTLGKESPFAVCPSGLATGGSQSTEAQRTSHGDSKSDRD